MILDSIVDMTPCSLTQFTDASKELTASILRAEETAETSGFFLHVPFIFEI
jgi:hypothetical protein